MTFGLDEGSLPRILTGRRVGGVRVLEWLVVLFGIPLFYLVTVLLDRLLRPLVAALWRRLFKDSTLFARHLLPLPIRLLLVAGGNAVAAERPAAAAHAPPVRVQRCDAPHHRGARLAGDPLQS